LLLLVVVVVVLLVRREAANPVPHPPLQQPLPQLLLYKPNPSLLYLLLLQGQHLHPQQQQRHQRH
jgi:hypothetical protein